MRLADALEEALGSPVADLRPIAGGDLNDAFAAELAGGTKVFVKTAVDAAPHAYTREAEGLRWLAEPGGLAVPEVLAVADEPGAPRFLALAWVEAGRRTASTDEELGRGLAAVHAAGAPAHGGAHDLVVGPLTLPNEPCDDWPSFYVTRRLDPLARMAAERGALPPEALARLDALAARMPELAGPAEPPARLHGDLWSGNVLTGADGRPWLIDPAAHGGHREIDLAMLRLFGAPGPAFLDAYEEYAPLADGHEERVELWQILPLLVHAVLFGGGYGASALAAMRRYT
ncbi:MAG: fructosamine kinase family protein [Acidimicrobiales bacterium]